MEVYEPPITTLIMALVGIATILVGTFKYMFLAYKGTYNLEDDEFKKRAIWTMFILAIGAVMLCVSSYLFLFELVSFKNVPAFIYLIGLFLGIFVGSSLFVVRFLAKNFL